MEESDHRRSARCNAPLDATLAYSALGLRVLPVHAPVLRPDGPPGCTCSDGAPCKRAKAGKHPRIKAWQTEATTDPAQIRRWWSGKWSGSNVGIACGPDSGGLLVLDLDGPAAEAAWEKLCAEHGTDPDLVTPTVQSGRLDGGRHLYLAAPGVPAGRFRNGVGTLAEGLDVRWAGGQVVAPPSIHATGRRYTWAPGRSPDDCAPAEAPPWLLARLRELAEVGTRRRDSEAPVRSPAAPWTGNDDRNRRYALGVLRRAADDVAASGKGTRNPTLNGAAYKLGGYVAAGSLAEAEVFDTLLAAADRCGLLHDDGRTACEDTIRSGLDAGRAKGPKEPPPRTEGWARGGGGGAPATGARVTDDGEVLDPGNGSGGMLRGAGEGEGHPVVANFQAVEVADAEGKTRTIKHAVPQGSILAAMHGATDGWPRTVGGLLFAHVSPPPGALPTADAIRPLPTERDLFAWLHERATVEWTGKEVGRRGRLGTAAPVSRGEFYSASRAGAPVRYQSAELLPHHPARPSTFYACGELPDGDGRALDDFVSLFNPATDLDRKLLLAALVTPGWGGEPGARPGFVLTSDHGVGSGKTATAEAIGAVWGGLVALQPGDDWGKACERLLSDNALSKRLVLVDNIKGRLSVAEFESAITAATINGRRLYHGDYERPNTLTWFLTVNVAELSRDLADRCVVVRIGPPQHGTDFKATVADFLARRRVELLRDVLALLRRPPVCTIQRANRDRFQAWQDAVLARLEDGDALAAEVKARRPVVDADATEAQDVADVLAELLRSRGHCPKCARVFIPSKDAQDATAVLFTAKTPHAWKRHIKQLAQNAPLRLLNADARLQGQGLRGLEWCGPNATGGQVLLRSVPGPVACDTCDALRPLYPVHASPEQEAPAQEGGIVRESYNASKASQVSQATRAPGPPSPLRALPGGLVDDEV